MSHQFPVLVVVGSEVETTVEEVVAVTEALVVLEVGIAVDVGLEVVVVASVDDVVELEQDARTNDTTIKQVNRIQVTPFFIVLLLFFDCH